MANSFNDAKTTNEAATRRCAKSARASWPRERKVLRVPTKTTRPKQRQAMDRPECLRPSGRATYDVDAEVADSQARLLAAGARTARCARLCSWRDSFPAAQERRRVLRKQRADTERLLMLALRQDSDAATGETR